MNRLVTVTDGEDIVRLSGTFGKNKSVAINNFGGITYLHLKAPKKSGDGWKTYNLTLMEYRELIRMAGPNHLATIAQNFDVQNRKNLKREAEARQAALLEESDFSNSSSGAIPEEPSPKRQRTIVIEDDQ